MRIENFASLLNAKLLNKPSVFQIRDIKTDVKKIKLADAFICLDTNCLNEALKNGAYCIVTDKKVDIIDEEIAWLWVENIHDAINAILRYKIIKSEINVIYANFISYEMLKFLKIQDFTFLNKNNQLNFNFKKYLICHDKKFLENLELDFLSIKNNNSCKLSKKDIFFSNFIYDNHLYQKIPIPDIFLNNFLDIFEFLNTIDIKINPENFTRFEHFIPLFVNSKMQIKSFGKTSKVLIFEDNKDFLNYELKILKNKKILKISFNKDILLDLNFKNPKEINKLKDIDFNFALIYADIEKIKKELEKNQTQSENLFDALY